MINLFLFKKFLSTFNISFPVIHIADLEDKFLNNFTFLELEKITKIFLFSFKNS